MSAAALPAWLDPELLQWIMVVALAVVLYLLYVVIRFVHRIVAKVMLLVALVGLGVSLWVQRGDLRDCAVTCECSLYGQAVDIPFEQLPEDLRFRDANGEAVCLSGSPILA